MNSVTIKGVKYPLKWSYKVLMDFIKAENFEYVDQAYEPMISWLNGGRLKSETLFHIPKIVKLMIENASGEELELELDVIAEDVVNDTNNALAIAKEIEDNSPKAEGEEKEDKKKVKD